MAAVFSSDRERRLWLWTAAVLIAIYSTLGLARTLVDELSERDLLPAAFVVGLVLVVGPIAWRWARKRPDWAEIGVALAVAFAYCMVWVRMESWAERTHLLEYGIVAALIHMALLERVRNGREVPLPAALAVGVTAVLGLVDECIQAVLPSRVFDFRDVFFNAFAGFMVVAARLAIGPQRGPGWRVWFLWLWATAIGWGQGVYLGWYADDDPKLLESIPSVVLAGYLGVVVGALLVGVLQWLVLRRHLARVGWWLGASLGAAAFVGAVVFGVGAIDTDVGWIVGVSLFGPVAGGLQWAVFRRQIPRASWWIVASTVGWAAAMPFGDIGGPPGLGAVYGAITATAMVWLLRQEPS